MLVNFLWMQNDFRKSSYPPKNSSNNIRSKSFDRGNFSLEILLKNRVYFRNFLKVHKEVLSKFLLLKIISWKVVIHRKF